jgi:hypothetical protein
MMEAKIGKTAFFRVNRENRKSTLDQLWELVCTRQGSNLQPCD